jgi:FKBP-type peptidyl-prolyl cis-trans isomerase SlyD
MKLQKSDFIEIDFTGKFKDSGEVFDSSLSSELKKLSPHAVAKPFTFALGHEMFLKGINDFLIGKEIDKFPKSFTIELKPEKAFGPRNSAEVKMIPMKIFKEHNVQPIPGASLNFDGRVARILSVSGGRVLVDFNGPLSGKEVVYEVKVLRKVDDINQKVKSLNEFLFKKDFPFEIKDKKIILEVDKEEIKPLIELFKDKFKEILKLELEVKKSGQKPNLGKNIQEKREKNPENKKDSGKRTQ